MAQFRHTANVVRNALRPRYLPETARKLRGRIGDRRRPDESAEARRWCAERVVDSAEVFEALDPGLWAEAARFAERFEVESLAQLQAAGKAMGGGGDYQLVYFLVRLLRPERVVETGVAAGKSSTAILTAMEANGVGHLWSSDFPYLRHDAPEADIGMLVPDHLRHRWTVLVQGDRINLPAILDDIDGSIGLFHYDSDKSRSGRALAMDLVSPRLARDAVVVFDDIQDNLHFRDLVAELDRPFHVVAFRRKYVGVLLPGPGLAIE